MDLLVIDTKFIGTLIPGAIELYSRIDRFGDPIQQKRKFREQLSLPKLMSDLYKMSSSGSEEGVEAYVFCQNREELDKIFYDWDKLKGVKVLGKQNARWNILEDLLIKKPDHKILLVADDIYYASIVEKYKDNRFFFLLRKRENDIATTPRHKDDSQMPYDVRYNYADHTVGECLTEIGR